MIVSPTAPFWSSDGQWALLLPALLALVLSALIGMEREARAKSAGLRTAPYSAEPGVNGIGQLPGWSSSP